VTAPGGGAPDEVDRLPEIDAYLAELDAGTAPEDTLTREQAQARWLHIAVAGALVADPATVLANATTTLDRLLATIPDGPAADRLHRWQETLAAGLDSVLDAMTARSDWAVDLRQNSPFTDALPEPIRRPILTAFVTHWKRRPPS